MGAPFGWMWVCSDKGYLTLPPGWGGCCYFGRTEIYMLRIPVTNLFNETGKTNSGDLKRPKLLILDNQDAYGHVLHSGEIFGILGCGCPWKVGKQFNLLFTGLYEFKIYPTLIRCPKSESSRQPP